MEGCICRYDIQGLADELEVELSDIVKLYSNYIEEMASEIEEMQKFLLKKDWVMLERVVHNIKGVSANLNIEDVFNEAEAFDNLLKKGVADDSGYYVNNIETLLKAAENEIKSFFAQYGLALGGGH